MRHVSRLMASGGSVLVLALTLSVATSHRADARGAYNSADTSGVMVDMGALDELGGGSNLPDLLLGRAGQPAPVAGAAAGKRGTLLQPDPSRGVHSRMLVTGPLIPPKGMAAAPVALTPPPGLTELPELVPEPPASQHHTPPAAPATTIPAAVAPPPAPAATPAPAPVAAEAAPAPAPAPAAEPAPEPQQVASAPATDPAPAAPVRPAAPTVSGNALATLPFNGSQTDLSSDARAALDAALTKLGSSSAIQVLAYASGDRDNPSKARRTSLSRALAVRAYLIDQGVASNRIDVRALGDQVKGGSTDRVDIFAGS